MKIKNIVAATALAALFGFGSSAQATIVSLELALLVDVSGSVDASEYALQKGGYVSAFTNLFNDPGVASYIATKGPIAVTYIEWSGASAQSQQVGWTQILDDTTSKAFATAINGTTRAFNANTAPGSAINFATPLFSNNGFEGARWVIDVSGDGQQNEGADTSDARDAFLATLSGGEGLSKAINGLAIGPDSLVTWYNANIVGGPGSFVLQANFNNFSATVADKIGREITAVPEPASLALLGIGLAGLGTMRRRKTA